MTDEELAIKIDNLYVKLFWSPYDEQTLDELRVAYEEYWTKTGRALVRSRLLERPIMSIDELL